MYCYMRHYASYISPNSMGLFQFCFPFPFPTPTHPHPHPHPPFPLSRTQVNAKYNDLNIFYVFNLSHYILRSLRPGRSGDRIPLGARFSAPVQAGPGAHLASYRMGTESFPTVKRTGRGVDHPQHLAPRLKKE